MSKLFLTKSVQKFSGKLFHVVIALSWGELFLQRDNLEGTTKRGTNLVFLGDTWNQSFKSTTLLPT